MRGRGTYGTSRSDACGSSWGTWVVGGLLVGSAVLWARHQSTQIEKLYAAAGLPHQSFLGNLRERSKELSTAAREKYHVLMQRRSVEKEA